MAGSVNKLVKLIILAIKLDLVFYHIVGLVWCEHGI